MELGGHGESLDLNASLPAQADLECVAGHLGGDVGDQASDRLAQQVFPRTPRVRHFVEGTLDPCPYAVEPRLAARGMGRPLMCSVGREEVDAPGCLIPPVPVRAHEAFVPDDVGLPETVPHRVGRDPLIRGSRDPIVEDGQTLPGTPQDPLVPQVLHRAADIHPIVRGRHQITTILAASVADDGQGFGIHLIASRLHRA